MVLMTVVYAIRRRRRRTSNTARTVIPCSCRPLQMVSMISASRSPSTLRIPGRCGRKTVIFGSPSKVHFPIGWRQRGRERRPGPELRVLAKETQDLEHLAGMLPEIDIHPLRPNHAAGVRHHKAHLGHPHHPPHGLPGFGAEVVSAGDVEPTIQ